jgi:hypothetical protein
MADVSPRPGTPQLFYQIRGLTGNTPYVSPNPGQVAVLEGIDITSYAGELAAIIVAAWSTDDGNLAVWANSGLLAERYTWRGALACTLLASIRLEASGGTFDVTMWGHVEAGAPDVT